MSDYETDDSDKTLVDNSFNFEEYGVFSGKPKSAEIFFHQLRAASSDNVTDEDDGQIQSNECEAQQGDKEEDQQQETDQNKSNLLLSITQSDNVDLLDSVKILPQEENDNKLNLLDNSLPHINFEKNSTLLDCSINSDITFSAFNDTANILNSTGFVENAKGLSQLLENNLKEMKAKEEEETDCLLSLDLEANNKSDNMFISTLKQVSETAVPVIEPEKNLLDLSLTNFKDQIDTLAPPSNEILDSTITAATDSTEEKATKDNIDLLGSFECLENLKPINDEAPKPPSADADAQICPMDVSVGTLEGKVEIYDDESGLTRETSAAVAEPDANSQCEIGQLSVINNKNTEKCEMAELSKSNVPVDQLVEIEIDSASEPQSAAAVVASPFGEQANLLDLSLTNFTCKMDPLLVSAPQVNSILDTEMPENLLDISDVGGKLSPEPVQQELAEEKMLENNASSLENKRKAADPDVQCSVSKLKKPRTLLPIPSSLAKLRSPLAAVNRNVNSIPSISKLAGSTTKRLALDSTESSASSNSKMPESLTKNRNLCHSKLRTPTTYSASHEKGRMGNMKSSQIPTNLPIPKGKLNFTASSAIPSLGKSSIPTGGAAAAAAAVAAPNTKAKASRLPTLQQPRM